ncbi:MAG: hypothetical protein Q9188_001364 [Gyalolechia gomerana]
MPPQRKNLVKKPVSSRVLRSSAKPLDTEETDDKAGTATKLLRDREENKSSLGVPNEHRMDAPSERKDTESTVLEKDSPDEQTEDLKTKSESKSKRKPRKNDPKEKITKDSQRKNSIDNANTNKLPDSANRIEGSRIEETPSSFSIHGKVNNTEDKDLTSTPKPVSPPHHNKMETITRRDEESSARGFSPETTKPPIIKAYQWSTPLTPPGNKRKHEDDSGDEIDIANSHKKPKSWFVWGKKENQE